MKSPLNIRTNVVAERSAEQTETHRHVLGKVRRVIVKIGSKSLTGDAWDRLAQDVAAFRSSGQRGARSVVIVSSGAIASGIQKLGLKSRPKDIARLQAA